MNAIQRCLLHLAIVISVAVPAFCTVTIVSLKPSVKPPQQIGTAITWTATATDTNTGPLTFQFNITTPNGKTAVMVKDFNVGTLKNGQWTAQPFVWVPTGVEGKYQIQVVAKDFGANQSVAKAVNFSITPLVTTGQPVAADTANPLVALFSSPGCPAGSFMQVVFQDQAAAHPATTTNQVPCRPSNTMTFEIGGMYESTAYNIHAQVVTGSSVVDGPIVPFTTGAYPSNIPKPVFKPKVQGNDRAYPVILHNLNNTTGGPTYPDVATDLQGNIIWYYYPNDLTHGNVLNRPLPGGHFLTYQDGAAWNPNIARGQYARQVDLAGNVVRETNIGALQQQLIALGAVDAGPCTTNPNPPVGSACIGAFHHDAIETLPNGGAAFLVDLERIVPAGTQPDPSNLPQDIEGDMIIVVNRNWQVVWYWDTFNPNGIGNPPRGPGTGYNKLPVTRAAVLNETCGTNQTGCPPMQLLGSSQIAPLAHDWLHANTLYYWPAPQNGNTTGGDIVWSSRNQDWVFRIDYRDGNGTGDILWRLGPSGDFTLPNHFKDRWPWFSHQHDVGVENHGTGVFTIFDNGNTRISPPTGNGSSTGGVPGLGSACSPHDCNSRGIALIVDQTAMAARPVLSVDLGYYSPGNGSAQMLENGNYFFVPSIVPQGLSTVNGYTIEVGPAPAAPQIGPTDFLENLQGPEHYRGWQLPNLYNPPTT